MPAADPRAHAAVTRALLTGELVRPGVCELCGEPPVGKSKIEAHHADYAKPLVVLWVCRKCHRRQPAAANRREDLDRTQVNLRLPEELIDLIDAQRGSEPRNEWLTRHIKSALEARGSFEDAPAPVVGRSPVPEFGGEDLAGWTDPRMPDAERSIQDVLRAKIAEIEDRPMFSEPELPSALNKYGDPIDTVYDDTDPRSFA